LANGEIIASQGGQRFNENTSYATEIARASSGFDAAKEGTIERIYVRGARARRDQTLWWKDGGMTQRPLALSENDLLTLLQDAIEADILTPEFRTRPRGTCSEATSTERLRRRVSIVQLKPEMLPKLGKLPFCKLV
jgi:hypothetical protein